MIDKHQSKQVALMTSILGDTRHDWLVERMQNNFNYTPADRFDMNCHYRKELKRMQCERSDGNIGYLNLVAWD